MNDHDKRLRFREILAAPHGSIAPSAPDPMFGRLIQDCGYPLMHVEAGADALGVGLPNVDEYRDVGAHPPAPLVNPWPRAGINSADELFALGFKVALMTSFVSLAALSAARTMLLRLCETGRVDGYFGAVDGYPEVRHWYEDLGFRPTQPFVSG